VAAGHHSARVTKRNVRPYRKDLKRLEDRFPRAVLIVVVVDHARAAVNWTASKCDKLAATDILAVLHLLLLRHVLLRCLELKR
jgi:hypothetical protein